MRNAKAVTIAAAIMLLSISLSIVPSPGEASGEGTRFIPEMATGDITSDQTWDGTFYTRDINIKEGVTVNITAGSVWKHPEDSYTNVEGTLLVEGTEENPVVIDELVTEEGWDGIGVAYTGRVIFQNFTMSGLANAATGITAVGFSSIVEN